MMVRQSKKFYHIGVDCNVETDIPAVVSESKHLYIVFNLEKKLNCRFRIWALNSFI